MAFSSHSAHVRSPIPGLRSLGSYMAQVTYNSTFAARDFEFGVGELSFKMVILGDFAINEIFVNL